MFDPRGVFSAIITPFNKGGELDLDYVTGHLRFQERAGIHGVVPSGSNGEGPSLSLDERKRLVEHVVTNKGKLRVIAGAGCASLPETIELTQFAASAGADAVLLLPPFYFKDVTPPGLAEYFRQVLDSASIPMLLYNIPALAGLPISDELLGALAGHPNLYGVKDSSGDPDRPDQYIKRFPKLRIFVGTDDLAETALQAGATGLISGLGNVYPELMVEIYTRFQRGEDVSGVQRKISRYKQVFKRYPFRGGSKYALTLRGFPMSFVRPPLVDLTEEQQAALQNELKAEGFPTETP